jgi:hypothetical protein
MDLNYPIGCVVTFKTFRGLRCPYLFEVAGYGCDDGGPTLKLRSLSWEISGPPEMWVCDAVMVPRSADLIFPKEGE